MFVSENMGFPARMDEPESESIDSEPSERIVLVGWPDLAVFGPVLAAGWRPGGLAACWPDGLVVSDLTRLLVAVSEPRSTLRKNPSLKNINR